MSCLFNAHDIQKVPKYFGCVKLINPTELISLPQTFSDLECHNLPAVAHRRKLRVWSRCSLHFFLVFFKTLICALLVFNLCLLNFWHLLACLLSYLKLSSYPYLYLYSWYLFLFLFLSLFLFLYLLLSSHRFFCQARADARKTKDFAKADAIRDELTGAAMRSVFCGVQLLLDLWDNLRYLEISHHESHHILSWYIFICLLYLQLFFSCISC